MDFKTLFTMALSNPVVRDLLAPALQKAAATALRALADEVEKDPNLIKNLIEAVAKAMGPR